jgi:Fe2+ transport system protein FeoA
VSAVPVPSHTPVTTSLDDLPAGQPAVIQMVMATGDIGERLLEMGLTPGTTIEVVRRAPFGDPLQVRLRGYLLALRRAQARAIRVQPTR